MRSVGGIVGVFAGVTTPVEGSVVGGMNNVIGWRVGEFGRIDGKCVGGVVEMDGSSVGKFVGEGVRCCSVGGGVGCSVGMVDEDFVGFGVVG